MRSELAGGLRAGPGFVGGLIARPCRRLTSVPRGQRPSGPNSSQRIWEDSNQARMSAANFCRASGERSSRRIRSHSLLLSSAAMGLPWILPYSAQRRSLARMSRIRLRHTEIRPRYRWDPTSSAESGGARTHRSPATNGRTRPHRADWPRVPRRQRTTHEPATGPHRRVDGANRAPVSRQWREPRCRHVCRRLSPRRSAEPALP